jgi:maleylacetate reductase
MLIIIIGIVGMETFHYVAYPQEVIFGPGSLSKLATAAERYTWGRLFLLTSPSQQNNGHAAALKQALGARLAGTFAEVLPHVQDTQMEAARAAAHMAGAEGFIALGGGSPIGMAKALAADLTAAHPEAPAPVIAIPTTYAGSEMTPVFGVTQTNSGPPRKVTTTNPAVLPRLVIYDPELTLDLPPQLTASTGMNALAHCIEAIYSVTRHPLSSAAALAGLDEMWASLLCCYQDGRDLEMRTRMLTGAHLAGFSLASVSMGLHHGLCHVLGGRAGVPHGIANAILLPHAVRFNAQACAAQLRPAAEATGAPDGPGLARQLAALAAQMNLPRRLREAGVQESSLAELAGLAFQNRTVQNNPRPIPDAATIEELLHEAW